ncbi:MAG: glycine cleavage system aminomethyltransferase GcvT [Clostridiales bacterium]|nr:glycine cleavage system aminomethyltransferase GcvT [Clostridiales bacterium]
MAKRTPLYDMHVKYGGHIVEFAGYDLPVQYEGLGVIKEHVAVRTQAGLFDVSHMGELIVSGENAEAAVNNLITNEVRNMVDGQVKYSLMTNDKGGEVDDVLVYKISGTCFLLVVNASNVDKDAKWVSSHLPQGVKFANISDEVSQLALQGPKAETILKKLLKEEFIPQKYYTFNKDVTINGMRCLVSQTGYTGEHGYEIYLSNADACKMYETLMEAGKDEGLVPAGLGARDTLRFEAAMPLYGHELGEDIPANETALGFCIKMAKENFNGKAALEAHTPEYTRVGAKLIDRGIARENCPVYLGDEQVGYVTSGTHSPTFGCALAMLRLKKGVEGQLTVDVRGKRLKIEIVPLPFYKRG